jgi:hypothetical protein
LSLVVLFTPLFTPGVFKNEGENRGPSPLGDNFNTRGEISAPGVKFAPSAEVKRWPQRLFWRHFK